MKQFFSHLYYRKSILAYLLLPFSLIYYCIISLRRWAYQYNFLKTKKLPVFVIVIGNITLGGTGKTPLVIYLIEQLRQQAYFPGVISRGYGAKAKQYPISVSQDSLPTEVGDEPLLIHLRTGASVVVDPNRSRAAKYLLDNNYCNIIISDDGLQHYALGRDIEIAILDSERGLGNGLLFPAGPLREPKSRLRQVDFIISNGDSDSKYNIKVIPKKFVNLITKQEVDASYFNGKQVIAMAGIGNPNRFFHTLAAMNINFLKHPLNDHYYYTAEDFNFPKNSHIIMTEKDAVKAKPFAQDNMWYLPIDIEISDEFIQTLDRSIKK